MKRIEMFTAGADLRAALHRVLALCVVLPEHDETISWWSQLDPVLQERASQGQLDLEQLSAALQDPVQLRVHQRVRRHLGLDPLDGDTLARVFRRCIVSKRAHVDHMARDIYGSANKQLWDMIVTPLAQALQARWGDSVVEPPSMGMTGSADAKTTHHAKQLVSFRTGPRDADHAACATWLHDELTDLGFTVRLLTDGDAPPVLHAHRPTRGLRGHLGMYAHYDTVGASAASWHTDPDALTELEGRWFARGIADNKGPLAVRLAALAEIDETPALTWLIQGEEETGATWARQVLPELVRTTPADLWLDETGYHDHESGTLRLLARTVGADSGSSAAPDSWLEEVVVGLRVLASRYGVSTRTEHRGLNKTVVLRGCPFDQSLLPRARTLALGINDSISNIHASNESVPTWTIPLHVDQLRLLVHAVGHRPVEA